MRRIALRIARPSWSICLNRLARIRDGRVDLVPLSIECGTGPRSNKESRRHRQRAGTGGLPRRHSLNVLCCGANRVRAASPHIEPQRRRGERSGPHRARLARCRRRASQLLSVLAPQPVAGDSIVASDTRFCGRQGHQAPLCAHEVDRVGSPEVPAGGGVDGPATGLRISVRRRAARQSCLERACFSRELPIRAMEPLHTVADGARMHVARATWSAPASRAIRSSLSLS